jgi:hypothetical protein
MFEISMEEAGAISVRAVGSCLIDDEIMGDRIIVYPRASNAISVGRLLY